MKKYLIVSQCLFLLACTNQSDSLENIICNDNIQYWNHNMIRDNQNVWFTFSFNKNGSVKKYSFNKTKNKRWLFTDYGYPSNFKWRIKKDSILEFMGVHEKIIKFSGDTLFTYNIEDKENGKYFRVRGPLHIQH